MSSNEKLKLVRILSLIQRYKAAHPVLSLLLISLPLLTLIPSPSPLSSILATSNNMTNASSNASGLSSEQLERMAQLEQLLEENKQNGEQAPPDANVRETITMRLTCQGCNNLNGKYNITVGMPEIDSPYCKSIVVNGSVFDLNNTQMGFIPIELDLTMDDEVVDVTMKDMNTGKVLDNSFDMSKTKTVVMIWPKQN